MQGQKLNHDQPWNEDPNVQIKVLFLTVKTFVGDPHT
jgi:hypothetical protein